MWWLQSCNFQIQNQIITDKIRLKSTVEHLLNVLLAIDVADIVFQKVLDYRPGYGGLNQVYGPNHPTHSMVRVSGA